MDTKNILLFLLVFCSSIQAMEENINQHLKKYFKQIGKIDRKTIRDYLFSPSSDKKFSWLDPYLRGKNDLMKNCSLSEESATKIDSQVGELISHKLISFYREGFENKKHVLKFLSVIECGHRCQRPFEFYARGGPFSESIPRVYQNRFFNLLPLVLGKKEEITITKGQRAYEIVRNLSWHQRKTLNDNGITFDSGSLLKNLVYRYVFSNKMLL